MLGKKRPFVFVRARPFFPGTRVIFMWAKLPGIIQPAVVSLRLCFFFSLSLHVLTCSLPLRRAHNSSDGGTNVRQNVGGLPYLPRRLDPLDHGQADQSPGGQQGQGHLPVEASAVGDAVGDVQGLAVPVVGGGRALLALGHLVCRTQRRHKVSAQRSRTSSFPLPPTHTHTPKQTKKTKPHN